MYRRKKLSADTKTTILAVVLIAQMIVLGWLSLRGDSLTTDESPHIVSGYSYLTQQDMRLNPEHPPLVKDLAGLPLLFQKVNFPADNSAWTDDINGQWDLGTAFSFESGNDPDKMMLASRTAMLLLLVVIGIYVFRWARERYGRKSALFALFLFSFSPTFLAHGRYITTDVGAALGFLLAFYFFIKFLQSPSKKHLVFAGIAFGIAQLLKFSLILLIPFFGGLVFLWWFVNRYGNMPRIYFWKHVGSLALIFIIGYLLVWPVYLYHTLDFPPERQMRDAAQILSSSPFSPAADLAVWASDKPILRPYGWYLTGLLMVFQRTAGGNTTYFLGDVSSDAWPHYFPTVFALKTPVPILAFILIALGVAAAGVWRVRKKWRWEKIIHWSREHFVELSWLLFVAYYWAFSVFGNLNIGIRHILPTLPFIYLLIAWQIQKWIRSPGKATARPFRILVFSALLIWYFFVSVFTFPFYLAYFNEIAGGPANGYKFVADSNLDWGQDLKRLAKFVETNNIEKIKIDYFGGDSPSFRLGNKYEQLDSSIPNQKGWLAISATLLQNGRGAATKGFDQSTTHYMWLNNYEPVAQIGFSIFVFNIE